MPVFFFLRGPPGSIEVACHQLHHHRSGRVVQPPGNLLKLKEFDHDQHLWYLFKNVKIYFMDIGVTEKMGT